VIVDYRGGNRLGGAGFLIGDVIIRVARGEPVAVVLAPPRHEAKGRPAGYRTLVRQIADLDLALVSRRTMIRTRWGSKAASFSFAM
jgi:hypothetical protein